MNFAELQIGLHQHSAGCYHVELRFSNPHSAGEIAPEGGNAAIDLQSLAEIQLESDSYGKKLSEQLFADEKVLTLWSKVKATVEANNLPLRVQLLVGPSAPELHPLRWELLRDPESGALLATSERIVFSRFMVSLNWRSIHLLPKGKMRALVAVSAPSDIESIYRLPKIDPGTEAERALKNLDGIQAVVAGKDEPLTIDSLIENLRKPFDIVYLVCHGTLNRRVPSLYFQSQDGSTEIVKGQDLADRLSDLPRQPRLFILASCESAGTGDSLAAASARVSLAPRLAEAGVCAVVAMQGKISTQTIEKAMPVFFRELTKDGRIDRAMAAARSKVRSHSDFWVPALFLRLKGGRIWYEPGFGEGKEDFRKWATIVNSVKRSRLTCILGPGLVEPIYGRRRDIAGKLASALGFPLAPYQVDQLPNVSQFVKVDQDLDYLHDSIRQCYCEEIRKRFPDAVRNLPQGTRLLDLVSRATQNRIGCQAINGESRQREAHQILAELPCKTFITVNHDDVLLSCLEAAGKKPNRLICNWRGISESFGNGHPPEVERPLIFHAMGHWENPDSLVLSEDEYFDYLIRVVRSPSPVPTVVEKSTVNESLLFLGFSLEDWSFRVLFRWILSLEGSQRLKHRTHVAVQLDPHEYDLLNPAKAKKYLDDYFSKEANMSIYWGTPQDFLAALEERLQALPKQDPDGATAG